MTNPTSGNLTGNLRSTVASTGNGVDGNRAGGKTAASSGSGAQHGNERGMVPATPETIDEVIAALDVVIAQARAERSRLGFFAVMYRNVTVRVKQAIAAGRFEDGARMERLDVVFAARYLDALAAWRADEPVSLAWKLAFDAAARRRPIILQHLLLGVNAHINLDLGLAVVAMSTPESLASLQRDYAEITTLLLEMIDAMQQRLNRVSPWLHLLDLVGHRTDRVLCGFGIDAARRLAWQSAEDLMRCDSAMRAGQQQALDLVVTALGVPIANPAMLATLALTLVGLREESDVLVVMDALKLE
jgi:hypothetical protein